MIVGMNEYELVYATAKVVTELCSLKKNRKVNARKKLSWKQKMEKEIEHLGGELSILSGLERDMNVKRKMGRKLKWKYKFNEENILMVKEKPRKCEDKRNVENSTAKTQYLNMIQRKFFREFGKEEIPVNETPAINDIKRSLGTVWSEESLMKTQSG